MFRVVREVLLKWKTAGNNVAPLVVVSTHLAKDKNRDGRDVILKQDLGQNLKLVWFIFLSKKHQEISKTYHD